MKQKNQPDPGMLCHQTRRMEAEEQEEDSSSLSNDKSETNSRLCLRYVPLGIAFLVLAGAAAATWYFLGKNSRFFPPAEGGGVGVKAMPSPKHIHMGGL